MSNYAVRVELHGADAADYEKLHTALAKQGFVRTVVGNGKTYRLPPGEYRLNDTSETATEVYRKAHAVAATVRPKPAIVVNQIAGGHFGGLDLDEPEAPVPMKSATAQGVMSAIARARAAKK